MADNISISYHGWPFLPFLDFIGPAVNALPFASHGDIQLDPVHAHGALHEIMIAHPSRIRSRLGKQFQHGRQKSCDPTGVLGIVVVLLSQHIRERPMSQAVNVPELAFAIEDLLGPFARVTEGLGKGAEEFNDLGDVIVIFAVLGSRLWVKEVVSCYQLEHLAKLSGSIG